MLFYFIYISLSLNLGEMFIYCDLEELDVGRFLNTDWIFY